MKNDEKPIQTGQVKRPIVSLESHHAWIKSLSMTKALYQGYSIKGLDIHSSFDDFKYWAGKLEFSNLYSVLLFLELFN